jgi:hypothetical protein
MKGDFSRRTHDPHKHYSAVLHEQGRLLTDADFDEEHRILTAAHETAVADLVGGCGAPIGDDGFAVTSPDGRNLALSPGRFYVDGILVVNDADAPVPYVAQPDRDTGQIAWPPGTGSYAVYLDVWHRLVTALDDPSIREVALGGPTTAARERTVWQVRHVPVDQGWTCGQDLPLPPGTTGRLAAQARPVNGAPTPCLVPPRAGYTGLENQLYRVEVLAGGPGSDVATATVLPVVSFPPDTVDQVQLSPADAAALSPGEVVELVSTGTGRDPFTASFAQVLGVDQDVVTLSGRVPQFGPGDAPAVRRAGAAVVVSRENGSVVRTVTRIDGTEISVADLGPDDVLGFGAGQWVELTDDAVEWEGLPRQLRQIESINTDRRVVKLRSPAQPLAARPDGVDPDRHPKLRRWDAARAVTFRANGEGWIHLENGIEVRFTAGDYVSGDYWQFPARTAVVDPESGTIEWRADDAGNPAERAPAGVVHHRSTLAVVRVVRVLNRSPIITEIHDCRDLFPPATALTTLLYVGGDGQEARRDDGAFPQLPAALTVRVARGAFPVAGARVRFTTTSPAAGQLVPANPVVTDTLGRAEVTWILDPDVDPPDGIHTAEAHLLDRAGNPIEHQVVVFHAAIEEPRGEGRGCCVCIGPDGDFPTVGAALHDLAARGDHDICLCLMPGDHLVESVQLDPHDKDRPLHLSVHGCGRGTRVWVRGNWRVTDWDSFCLRDLDITFGRGSGMITVGVDDVRIEGVHGSGFVGQNALVRIHDAQEVLVAGCTLAPRTFQDAERLATMLADLAPLDRPWLVEDEHFEDVVRRVAAEFAEAPKDVRLGLAERLRRLAGDGPRHLPNALASRFQHLAEILAGVDPGPGLAGVLRRLPTAIGAASGLVALEIGTRDDHQGDLGNPALSRRARIVVARNDLIGDLSFYGRALADRLKDEEIEALRDWVKEGALHTGMAGTVHVRENHFGRLRISVGMTRALREFGLQSKEPLLTVYHSFHVTDNVVDGVDGEILARHVHASGNEFTLDAVPGGPTPPIVVTRVTADSAVITANHGRLVAAAGGAVLQIDQLTRVIAEDLNLELQVV